MVLQLETRGMFRWSWKIQELYHSVPTFPLQELKDHNFKFLKHVFFFNGDDPSIPIWKDRLKDQNGFLSLKVIHLIHGILQQHPEAKTANVSNKPGLTLENAGLGWRVKFLVRGEIWWNIMAVGCLVVWVIFLKMGSTFYMSPSYMEIIANPRSCDYKASSPFSHRNVSCPSILFMILSCGWYAPNSLNIILCKRWCKAVCVLKICWFACLNSVI